MVKRKKNYDTPNRAATQLYMLMLDEGYRYGVSHGLNSSYHLYKQWNPVDETPEQRGLMTRANWCHGMLEQIEPKDENKKLPWYMRVYRLTDKAKEWVAQERPKIEQWLANKAAEDAKTIRLVIIREWHSRYDSHHFGVPEHVHGLFRVTSETEKRLYGELVEPVQGDSYSIYTYNLVHGGGRSKMYIDREQIVVDNATADVYARMMKVDEEWMADLDTQERTFKAELAALRAQYKRNTVQAAAMYADMFREAGAPKEAVDKIMDEVRGKPEIGEDDDENGG